MTPCWGQDIRQSLLSCPTVIGSGVVVAHVAAVVVAAGVVIAHVENGAGGVGAGTLTASSGEVSSPAEGEAVAAVAWATFALVSPLSP